MALTSKRFAMAKKTVAPRRGPARSVGIDVLVHDSEKKSSDVPGFRTTILREPRAMSAAAIFELSITGRGDRLRAKVDKAISDSDVNRKRTGSGKVIVKA
jgi:hypothetical protein